MNEKKSYQKPSLAKGGPVAATCINLSKNYK